MFCIQSNGISHVSRCWVLLDPMGSILSKLRETWHALNGKQKTAKQTKRMCLFYPKRIYEYTSVLEGVEHRSAIYSFYVIIICETVYPRCSMYGICTYIYPQNYLQSCHVNRPATWGASGYVIYMEPIISWAWNSFTRG